MRMIQARSISCLVGIALSLAALNLHADGLFFTAGNTSETLPYGASATVLPIFANGAGQVKDELGAVTFSSVATGNFYTSGALASNKTFTLTVANPAGDTTAASVVVTITPIVVAAIVPAAPTVTVGTTTNFAGSASGGLNNSLNWTATGGTINASNGQWTAPWTPGSYTVTATSVADPTKHASTPVTVVAVPTVSVSVGSSVITQGNGTTLTWSSGGSSYVNITNYGNNLGPSGSVAISPGSTTTYTGTAFNLAGTPSSTSSVTLTVWGVPSIGGFTASPVSVAPGGASTLYPVFNAPGGSGSISPSIGAVGSGGSYGTGGLSSTTTYTLTATNGAGSDVTAQTTVTVTAGLPPVLSFLGFYTNGWVDNCGSSATGGVMFTATCDSWQMTAPNGKSWSGGPMANTSWGSPAFVTLNDDFCQGELDENYASCGLGTWTLKLTRNGQNATSYIVYEHGCMAGTSVEDETSAGYNPSNWILLACPF